MAIAVTDSANTYIVGYTFSANFPTHGYYQTFQGSSDVFITKLAADVCCIGHVGDVNGLGGDAPSLGDVSLMIDAKLISHTCDGLIDCLEETDINQSGSTNPTCDDITLEDISILLDYLFITGPTLGLPECL